MAKKIRIVEDETDMTLICDCGEKTIKPKADLKLIEQTPHIAADSKADPPVEERAATYYDNIKQHDCENPECDAVIFIGV